MLYYVKTDILFNSMDVNIEDDEKEKNYNFYFDVGGLQSRQNNEKKEKLYTNLEKWRTRIIKMEVEMQNLKKSIFLTLCIPKEVE